MNFRDFCMAGMHAFAERLPLMRYIIVGNGEDASVVQLIPPAPWVLWSAAV